MGSLKEIARVRTEVERHQGRLRLLQDPTSLSTVALRIHETRGDLACVSLRHAGFLRYDMTNAGPA